MQCPAPLLSLTCETAPVNPLLLSAPPPAERCRRRLQGAPQGGGADSIGDGDCKHYQNLEAQACLCCRCPYIAISEQSKESPDGRCGDIHTCIQFAQTQRQHPPAAPPPASPAWAEPEQACNNTLRARRSCRAMSSSSTMAQHSPPSTQRSTASWTQQRRMQQQQPRRSKARAPRGAPTGPWT